MSKLLPCPFCGGVDIIWWSTKEEFADRELEPDGLEDLSGGTLVCNAAAAIPGCGASSGWAKTKAEAVILWNVRKELI